MLFLVGLIVVVAISIRLLWRHRANKFPVAKPTVQVINCYYFIVQPHAFIQSEYIELSNFVDMVEVTPEDSPTQPTGLRQSRIVTLSQWLERFSIMAATIATRFPRKAPELFAYQALIIRAERTFESACWVAYDCQFRRQALSRGDLNWSVPDACLYNISFTGRASISITPLG